MSKEKLIDLEHEQLGLVKVIIRRHIPGKTVWAYGSRVTWKASDISDLDLAVFGCSSAEVGDLKEAFEESSLLVSVGVMDWESNPEKFAESVGQRYVVVQRGLERWREVRLEDVAEKIAMGPFGSNIKVETFKTKGIPIISGQHLHETRLRDNEFNFISGEHADKLRNSNVFRGDVVFTHAGNIGQVSFIPENSQFKRYVLSQRQFYLRCRKDKINYEFITYYFKSPYGQHQILANSSQTGVPSLAQPATFLKNLKITLPSLPEQKAIAEVLSSLDDKIDLLHRQNKTLENMAQALFRKWFVEEADGEWDKKGLLEVIELIGGGTPKTAIAEYWDGNIPWLSGGDIASNHKTFASMTTKKISSDGLRNSSAKLLPQYATVISARGTVGKYCLLSKPMAFSQSNYGVLPRHKKCFFFTYLLLDHIVEELNSAAYGSVFDTITTATFKDIYFALPQEDLIEKFEASVNLHFKKILINTHQISTLENLRGILLPKLMNGEVRVRITHSSEDKHETETC